MAVPNPERELERLRRSIAGRLPPFLLVLGPSRFFRNEAVDLALRAVPPAAELVMIEGEGDSDGSELQHLRGGGLFARQAVVCVRRGDAWLKRVAETLEATLPKIHAGSALVLDVQKLDRRTKLGKALAAGAAFEFRELYTEPYDRTRSPADAEVVGWLQERARGHEVPVTTEAALLLLATVGKDPAELVAELGRLRATLGATKKPLSPAELHGKLSVAFESTPFEFAEALLAGDRRRCERSLTAMFARGIKGRDGETIDQGGLLPFIVSWTHQALCSAHEGRMLFDRGVARRELAERAGVRVFQERWVEQVVANPLPKLRHGLLALRDVQRELRTTGEDPERLLQRFVRRFLDAGRTWQGSFS